MGSPAAEHEPEGSQPRRSAILLSSYLDIEALICPTFTYSEHMCKQLKMLS